ncbi:MAG: hypothetical protein ACK57E_10660 [Erythrobacteraceae bacterium]|jgi:hypothetical protein
MKRVAPLFALTLLAAACTDGASGPAARGGEAAGEVAGGSISDAMIPLEQLESEGPLAPRQEPAPTDLDAEQPVVTPVEGVEGAPPSEGAEPAPADPAPEPSE